MLLQLDHGITPGDRLRMSVAFLEVRQNAAFQLRAIVHVTGRQDLALERREDQFDLIQPRRVDGEPVDANFEGELETTNPRLDLLGRMGRPIVQDEMQHRDPLTPEAAEEHVAEDLEIHEALTLKTAGEGLPLMDQQRGEEVEDAMSRVASPDSHGLTRLGSRDAAGHLQRLHAGLLIGTDDEFPTSSKLASVFVEIQDHGGLLQEPGVGRSLPRVVLPGLDPILAEPRPDRGGRNA